MQITDEVISKAHQYLRETQGNREDAAVLLRIKPEELDKIIKTSPVLTAQYGGANRDRALPAGAAGAAVRQDLPTVIAQPPAPRIATELALKEKSFDKSLALLGFNPREAQEIVTIEEFAGEHFERSLAMLHGGMVKTAMRLVFMAKHIEENYLNDPSLEQTDRDSWWDIYFRILENLRKQNDQAQKSALTRAIIKEKQQQKNALPKPGFTPGVAIQITNPTNVSVSQSPRPETQPAPDAGSNDSGAAT